MSERFGLDLSRGALAIVAFCVALGGCAIWPATPQSDQLLRSWTDALAVGPTPLTWIQQDDNHCGPSALAMVMQQADVTAEYDAIVKRVYTPGRQGSLQVDMMAAPRHFGLASYRVQPSLSDLFKLNMAGSSPVVLLNLGLDALPRWHYAVVVGHDLTQRDILLTSGTERLQRIPVRTFELMWARGGYWAMVIAKPDHLPETIHAEEAEKAALAFERDNPPQSSASLWRALRQRWPDRLLPWLGLSHAYMQDQQWMAARDTLLHTTQHFDSAVAWNNLAHVWMALRDPPRARAAANQALRRAQSAEPKWLPAVEDTLRQIGTLPPAVSAPPTK